MKSETLKHALTHLKKDERLKKIIVSSPKPEFKRGRNAYGSLVRSIIYQQLSGKAAGTILKRFLNLYGGTMPTPELVIKTPVAKLRSVGLSSQKTAYLYDLSEKFVDGTINPRVFSRLSDEEIREHLIRVKGIGRWTADMFLMFFLNREDVLPTGDLGIQKGFQKIFRMKKLPTEAEMLKRAERWQPYRTVASWYLWRVVDTETENADW